MVKTQHAVFNLAEGSSYCKKVASKLEKHTKRNNLENLRLLGYDVVLTDE
jgi:hypothetical protein